MTSPSTKRSASPPTTAVASTTGQASNPSKAISNQPAIGGRARPPPRSNFDLEPNPFEHSFSSTSVVSHSSSTDTPKQDANSVNGANNSSNGTSKAALTNGPNGAAAGPNAVNGTQTTKENDDSKPMLPPLSSIESPADHGFGPWGLASSLRSGPLSPAMLAGPASQQTPSLGLGAFDSSFVRTGLTPDVNRTGLTPLIGGPGGFPPPSPNTAALFALVNGTSSATLGSSVAITPGTLNAITGALSSSLGNLHPPTSMSLDTQTQQLVDAAAQQQSQGQFHQPDAFSAPHDSASHAISNAASALYLLSQQQSSLQRNQNQAPNQVQGQVNPSAVSGPVAQPESPTTTAAAATRRATKRKAVEAPAPVPRGKKTKSAASISVNTRGANRRKNSKLDEEEDDDEDDEDDDDDIYMEGLGALPGMGANARTNSSTNRAGGAKKPETEEEKRRNFLERNRQAALKCRQRKKAWLQALQAKVEFLTAENERLSSALVSSREEIARLSQAVVAHGGAPSALLNMDHGTGPNGPNAMATMGSNDGTGSERSRRDSGSGTSIPGNPNSSQPVHVNVSLSSLSSSIPASAPIASGIGAGHSHSLSLPMTQTFTGPLGHARSHSHGHNHVPPAQNGVTVGGRGYGY